MSTRKKRRRRPAADLLGKLTDAVGETPDPPPQRSPAAGPAPLTRPDIEALLETLATDPVADVRMAAQTARQKLAGARTAKPGRKEEILLSTIERIIFLKKVAFFQGMTIDQLQVLATICEEELFEEDERIFEQGEPARGAVRDCERPGGD